jgi:aryl-phospho-beta-D-glucosidase BglC (GH1 family)
MIGVNLSGAEFGSVPGRYGYEYIYPSQSDLSYYANIGVQIVRLPVRWERLQPTVGGALDTAEVGRLETFLDNAANTGVKVIIDLHNFGADFGNKLGTSGASDADLADFWQKLSAAVGNKSAVAGYDLMNEPNNLGNATEWPAAAQAAINAIRSVDTSHAIYIEGDNWASALNWSANNANLNLSDPANKLIYEAHLYFDKYSTGTYQGTYDSEGATANMAAAELQDFSNWLTAHNAKGFIGEFAVPDNDPRWLPVLDNMLKAMQADGLDGTYWGGWALVGELPARTPGSRWLCQPTAGNFGEPSQ